MADNQVRELEDELNDAKDKIGGLKDLIKDKKAEYREIESQQVKKKTF